MLKLNATVSFYVICYTEKGKTKIEVIVKQMNCKKVMAINNLINKWKMIKWKVH